MRYHNILHDDIRNGMGLRVTLFVSGCSHNCKNCHNPETHDPNSGVEFTEEALEEIKYYLNKKYTAGITLSGGDPLYPGNLDDILKLVKYLKEEYPTKDIWIYTGYTWEQIAVPHMITYEILKYCDVAVTGPYIEAYNDENYPWAGSTNQRVVDVQKSLKEKTMILYDKK